MVFSSMTFLFAYLPVVLVIYYITPLKYRNALLLLANLVFYGWGEPVYITIMFVSTFIDYTHGMLVEKYRSDDKKARRAVASSVIFNLLLLGFFKYFDFFALNLAKIPGLDFIKPLGIPLPIGISFYTFQTMSYTIDVYRQDAAVQRNIVNFGTFVTLFPQLIAGPIIKYKDLGDQIDERTHETGRFASGVRMFIIGLSKKVLIANNVGMLWDIYSASGAPPALGAWLGLIAFTFQIYFDFSGYSDMAVGLGRMFGFEFMENFNYPYVSASITEFWRRWHISLSTWFRDYVYIPLGGNRKGSVLQYRNIFIVWLLTGFWHGASWNFMLWGLYYAVFLILEKAVLQRVLQKLPKPARHIYAILVFLIGWVIFAIEDFSAIGSYLGALFGAGGFADSAALYYLRSYLPVFAVAAVGSTPLPKKLWQKLPERAADILSIVLCFAALLVCTAYLVDSTYNPFLYFRF